MIDPLNIATQAATAARLITIEDVSEIPILDRTKAQNFALEHKIIVPKIRHAGHADPEELRRMYCSSKICSISFSDSSGPGPILSLAGKKLLCVAKKP